MSLDGTHVVGFDELNRKMIRLDQKVQRRVMRAAMRKGLTIIKRGIKSSISQPKGKGRSTKRLKAMIGTKITKDAKNNLIAKAGIKVGVKSGTKQATAGRHGVLVALGTTQRIRKRIGGKFKYLERSSNPDRSTGAARGDDFVGRGFRKAQSEASRVMSSSLKSNIEKEANKSN